MRVRWRDVFCNNCGHRNPAGSNFCSSCGAPLETGVEEHTTITFHPVDAAADPADDEVAVDLDDLPAGVGVLVVQPGPERRARGSLSTRAVTTAGRHPDSDIFLDDITVSRRHAEVDARRRRLRGARRRLAQRHLPQPGADRRGRRSTDGDELQIGKFKLVFFAGPDASLSVVTERSHLSIGEVLGLLQDEFPDVTISKIRFLESQGLLDPERTPSGYRKFYEADIERLRWILREQRENFLPLKVIKDRLDSGEPLGDSEPTAAVPTVPSAESVGE